MDKIKITLATVGHMPLNFQSIKVKKWVSKLFEIHGDVENYSLRIDSDGDNWDYSDDTLRQNIPKSYKGDILIAIVNVPLELNWYSRRLNKNQIVFSFHEIKEFLDKRNIPLENVVYRLLYAYSLVYKRTNGNIVPHDPHIIFTHDETRGCIFDMNGLKDDITESCDSPIICDDCVNRLRNDKVSENCITEVKKELRKIRKPLFYRILSFIKKHPIWALLISGLSAVTLGIIASVISAYLLKYLGVT